MTKNWVKYENNGGKKDGMLMCNMVKGDNKCTTKRLESSRVPSIRIQYDNTGSHHKIKNFIKQILEEHGEDNLDIVCIGCDGVLYDSTGPMIGTLLTEQLYSPNIFGTLDNQITRRNVDEYIEYYAHNKRKVSIAIDACIANKTTLEGGEDEIGTIIMGNTKIYPAAVYNKVSVGVGDYSIKIITCARDQESGQVVSPIKLQKIYGISNLIASSISEAYKDYRIENQHKRNMAEDCALCTN